MLYFILGIIAGLLIRTVESKGVSEIMESLKKPILKTQFLEPKSFKEKFSESKNISDTLDG